MGELAGEENPWETIRLRRAVGPTTSPPSQTPQKGALRQPLYIGDSMNLGTILIILLVLVLIGALPTWPHSAHWGYYPTGGLGLLLIIVIVLVVMGRI